jgi:hypothetical protein
MLATKRHHRAAAIKSKAEAETGITHESHAMTVRLI